ncbi:MAG: hypothetical protein D6712_20885 [Chloroflexi bacterium]|nr:MAG: hypothetical protein D6712_20885 [Chloroflexota bacterium]
MTRQLNLLELSERVGAIVARANGIKRVEYRTLRSINSADLPLVVVVIGSGNDVVLSSEQHLTTRSIDLNVYVKPQEQGRAYEGYEETLTLLNTLRDVLMSTPRLELDALNDAPRWFVQLQFLGDTGFSVLNYDRRAYAGTIITLSAKSYTDNSFVLP